MADKITARYYTDQNPPPSDKSLGITLASVGDIIKIKAVDDNGSPTEYEKLSVTSETLKFYLYNGNEITKKILVVNE